MKYCLNVLVCLTVSASAATALGQTQAQKPDLISKPVAYVYVSGPNQIYGYSTAANGKLTPIPGSPFKASGDSITINQKHLYAVADDGVHLDGYAIADNGSLKLASSLNVAKYYPYDCGNTGNLQSDRTGATVYVQLNPVGCDEKPFIQTFKVDATGDLQYQGLVDSDIPTYQQAVPLRFAAGDKFAYQTGCGSAVGGGVQSLTERFKRESNGLLVQDGFDDIAPKAKDPGFVYCSEDLAADKNGDLALGFLEYNENDTGVVGPLVLASYQVNAEGQLSTKSTYANMPTTDVSYLFAMSLSPAANLLAVGGEGFQIFHFNGSGPITHYSGLLQPGLAVEQFYWDKDNHLYIASGGKLYVYTVTPTSIQQAPGSPYGTGSTFSLSVMALD